MQNVPSPVYAARFFNSTERGVQLSFGRHGSDSKSYRVHRTKHDLVEVENLPTVGKRPTQVSNLDLSPDFDKILRRDVKQVDRSDRIAKHQREQE